MAKYSGIIVVKWYPWLNCTYRQILRYYQKNRGHHSLLLHSQVGNGEVELSYAIIRWLMCRHPSGIKSCNICHSCQLMKVGNHPDYYQIKLEKGQHNLGVDIIYTIIDKVYSHAYQGGVKTVWLPCSEKLTIQAVNALLKILEEPPKETYFLLGCQDLSRLLPTLRSRCLYWLLPIPEESIGLQWLQQVGGYDLQAARAALRLCNGALLSAEKLLQPKRWQARLTFCSTMADIIVKGNFLSLLPILNIDQDNGSLNWLLSLLADTLKWQQCPEVFLTNVDQKPLISALATRLPVNVLYEQWQQWLNCRRLCIEVSGINYELVFTHYLLNWEKSVVGVCSNYPINI